MVTREDRASGEGFERDDATLHLADGRHRREGLGAQETGVRVGSAIRLLGDAAGATEGALAPRFDWSEMRESEHFVQLYETDAFLLDSLRGFIGTGLGAGDVGIVIATKAHREGLEEQLQADGLNLAAARAAGQYVALDAVELLSTFMRDGMPEPGRFREVL